MTQFKKTQVVMLSTEDKTASILYYKSNKHSSIRYFPSEYWSNNDLYKQHLYFLSDEMPIKGDYILCYGADGDVDIPKVLKYTGEELGIIKIIASTDKSLGLPRPSDSFIKKYCELGGIEYVMVEYIDTDLKTFNGDEFENILNLKVAPDNTITIKSIKDSWNREEVIKIVKTMNSFPKHLVDKWIEDNL